METASSGEVRNSVCETCGYRADEHPGCARFVYQRDRGTSGVLQTTGIDNSRSSPVSTISSATGVESPKDILVDENWNIVLIDHSQAFLSGYYLHQNLRKRPQTFGRHFVKELKQLKLEFLRFHFGRLLLTPQIDAIIMRREALLAHLDELIEKNGEKAVLFESASPRP